MKTILSLLLLLLITGCASQEAQETGQLHACTANQECWCREFTGAEFLDGKSKSYCCSSENVDGLFCKKANACADCFYD